MARTVEPREIDFSQCGDWGHRVFVNCLDPTEVTGPTTFTFDTDGQVRYHTGHVPEFRMKRARRILWECRQRPEWPYRQASFFRHRSLRNLPYVVLRQLVKESEGAK